MYFDDAYKNKLGFHYKKTIISDLTRNNELYIDIMFWFHYNEERDDLTLNIFSNQRYTNDNELSEETKKVVAVCEIAKAFEEFEKEINNCIEEILEEQ